ncbi:uncharacterized protein LOC130413249 [Triplophysa dalaica]|uniref:uncharacterized protein LOC130413249 n=1 Tax=Triplophysa dalaica TaxID=1582913 RepID=UPI0024DFD49A|nr:uncharacterized protein LOC130413249 [Triplophysa dalaica]
MQLTEDKRIKRKSEKRDQCCPWEVLEDNGMNDDEFQECQMAKQKVLHKCHYLDERNIILSPNLIVQSRSDTSVTNDSSDGANTRWKASQISVLAKPSASPGLILTRTVAPNHSIPINPSDSTDTMTQKQNIVLSENPTALCFIGVSEALPMIEWIPTSSHVQPSEETTGWRIESLSANLETTSPQPSWKRASVHRLEWIHECPAKVAHLGSSSLAANGQYAARPRVIRRVARVSGAYRAAPVQSGHVEEKLCPYRLPDHHNVLHKSCYQTGKEICLCSSLQPRARHSPEGDQREATQILQKIEKGQKQEFSQVIKVMDTQCHSGWPRTIETPPSPHHVTFSHILQVLQSKPANFPKVRGQRRH